MKHFISRLTTTAISIALIFSGFGTFCTYPVFASDITTDIDDTSEASEATDTNDISTEGATAEDGSPIDASSEEAPQADISDPNAPEIVANNAIVMDVKTGTILYEKNAYDRCYPASITKVLTCLVALEHVDMSSTVTFSYDSIWGIERDSNHIALDVGEQITAEQCFYGILLQSANEASWGMAEHVAGSLDAFADMMNAKAEELGCLDTHFVNANGLHDDDHYTTCYDMALITKAAIQNPMFRTIDETLYYQIPPTNLCDKPRDLWHQLKMLYPTSPYYYEYCEGGKTGYTDEARNTLTTYAEKNGMELICVMMDCEGAANCYTDSAALYEYYFNNYTYIYPLESFNPNTTNQSDYILNNFYHGLDHDTFNLSVNSDMAVMVPIDTDTNAITTYASYYDTIAGNVVGNVTVYYDGALIGQSDITYNEITVNGEVLTWGAAKEQQKKIIGKILLVIAGCFILSILVLFIIAQLRNRRYRYLKRRNRSAKLHF